MTRLRILIVVLLITAFCGFTILGVTLLGRGGELQFSPDTFEHRSLSFYQVPFTEVRLLINTELPHQKRIVTYWANKGFFVPKMRTERWHTVTSRRAADSRDSTGVAFGFWRFCSSDAQQEEWINWSERNPALSSQLWPLVVKLLSSNRFQDPALGYHFAGTLMMQVHAIEDPHEFAAELEKWQQYVRTAQ